MEQNVFCRLAPNLCVHCYLELHGKKSRNKGQCPRTSQPFAFLSGQNVSLWYSIQRLTIEFDRYYSITLSESCSLRITLTLSISMYYLCDYLYLYRVYSELLFSKGFAVLGILSYLHWSHPPHKPVNAVTPHGDWALVVRLHCKLGIV